MGCWNLGQPCVRPVPYLPVLWLWPNPLLNTLSLMLPYEIFFPNSADKIYCFSLCTLEQFCLAPLILSSWVHFVFCFNTWLTTGGLKLILPIFSPYHRARPVDRHQHSLNPVAFRKTSSHIGREVQNRKRGTRAHLSSLSVCPASLLIYLKLPESLGFPSCSPNFLSPSVTLWQFLGELCWDPILVLIWDLLHFSHLSFVKVTHNWGVSLPNGVH